MTRAWRVHSVCRYKNNLLAQLIDATYTESNNFLKESDTDAHTLVTISLKYRSSLLPSTITRLSFVPFIQQVLAVLLAEVTELTVSEQLKLRTL